MFDGFSLRFFDLGLLGLELNGDGHIAFFGQKEVYSSLVC
jgi:hypothetical protein